MSLPFQLGTHASPRIVVTTNGPTPDLIVCATVFDAGSTIAIEFLRICGTHTWPSTTSGSPSAGAPASGIVVTTALDCGSMRASPCRRRHPDGVVGGSRPACAALDRDPREHLVRGRIDADHARRCPSPRPSRTRRRRRSPSASFHRFTTRFFAGSMRSSSPWVNAVVQAEPNANIVSYGVNPTLIAQSACRS